MDFEDRQIFYVSSQNRISGTSSNFTYKFDLDQTSNYDSVVCLSASVPKSYYLITQFNDEFILQEGTSSIDIHVPVGNYTITAWKNILTTLLNTYSPNHWVYAVTFPNSNTTNTGKLKFSVSGNGSTQPQFIFNEYLYKQFGFDTGTYIFVGNELYSSNVINLQLLDAIFINSNICNNKHDSVLQEIYSNGSDYSNLTYQATSPTAYSKQLAIKNNTTYTFFLTNTYGNEIDLNGLDWNFTLLLYKKNNTLDMIKNYIKLTLME